METAFAAMGACNFPVYGCKGEDVLRDSCCHVALLESGVVCPNGSVVVDLACGTGIDEEYMLPGQEFYTSI